MKQTKTPKATDQTRSSTRQDPVAGKNGIAIDPRQRVDHTGMPDPLKGGIENLSGLSMDGVKVHYNSSEPANFNALAFAQGQNIHLAPNQERHLPHEAWHVVQQMQGRVKPAFEINGAPINSDASLEREATIMGAQALQASHQRDDGHAPKAHEARPPARTLQAKAVIQCTPQEDIVAAEQEIEMSEGLDGPQDQGTTDYTLSLGVHVQHANYIDFALARSPIVGQRKSTYKQRKRAINLDRRLRRITRQQAENQLADLEQWNANERAEEKTRAAQAVLGDAATEQEIDDLKDANQGHTWVEFSRKSQQQLQKRYSFGFKPSEGGALTGKNDRRLIRMPGLVKNPDDGHAHEGSFKDYGISAGQYRNAVRSCAAKKANPPTYEMLGYNCTAFAKEIMSKANLAFSGTRVTVPLPGVSKLMYPKPYSPNLLLESLQGDQELYQRGE